MAARTEFSEDGLDGARISSITSRAGVSKGAFYLHFKTKEHAFEEVASDFFGTFYRMMGEMDALLESDQDLLALHEQLLERDVAMMEFLWGERAFALILFEGARSSRHCHLIEAFANQVQRQIANMLAIDQRHGRVRTDLNLETIAAFLAGGFDRYARRLLASPTKPDIRADLQQLQSFFTLGLAPHLAQTFAAPATIVPKSASRPLLHAIPALPSAPIEPSPLDEPQFDAVQSGAQSS
jgi:AcrR family transcriptional regulator